MFSSQDLRMRKVRKFRVFTNENNILRHKCRGLCSDVMMIETQNERVRASESGRKRKRGRERKEKIESERQRRKWRLE